MKPACDFQTISCLVFVLLLIFPKVTCSVKSAQASSAVEEIIHETHVRCQIPDRERSYINDILFTKASGFFSIRLSVESRLFVAWQTVLITAMLIAMFYLCRQMKAWMRNQSNCLTSQQILWFRLIYQAPFVAEIRYDEQQRQLYEESVLRKVDGLAEHHRKFGDDRFCSIFIGCLAFYANEKRANVSWQMFRDSLVENFKDEILSGKIMPHVINDHYKGKWDDLVDAARRKDAETR
jgi:hypothetical protein